MADVVTESLLQIYHAVVLTLHARLVELVPDVVHVVDVLYFYGLKLLLRGVLLTHS